MICTYRRRRKDGTFEICAGCGTVWKNNILIDCPRCGGSGEERRGPPTYSQPILNDNDKVVTDKED